MTHGQEVWPDIHTLDLDAAVGLMAPIETGLCSCEGLCRCDDSL